MHLRAREHGSARRTGMALAVVAALATFVGVTSAGAGGATQTSIETTAMIDLSATPPCEREWMSDDVLHYRGCSSGGVFSDGDFDPGALNGVTNGNLSFKTGEGSNWGTVTYVTPIGIFEGSYSEKIALHLNTFVLTLEGNFVGRSEDGRQLKLAWIGTGSAFGVITYAVEGTILDPAG